MTMKFLNNNTSLFISYGTQTVLPLSNTTTTTISSSSLNTSTQGYSLTNTNNRICAAMLFTSTKGCASCGARK